MARMRTTPHPSPDFVGDINRDIPRTLAGSASTAEDQAQLLSVSTPEETPVPTNWIGQQQAVLKAQHDCDLEKALRIITTYNEHGFDETTLGEPVTMDTLAWAKEIGMQEKNLTEAKEAAAQSDAAAINKRSELSSGAQALFAAIAKSSGDAIEAELDSDLSDVPADLSEQGLQPEPKSKGKAKAKAKPAPKKRGAKKPASPTEPEGPSVLQERIAKDPNAARLAAAIKSLSFNDNPPDRPSWLTGLRQPLPTQTSTPSRTSRSRRVSGSTRSRAYSSCAKNWVSQRRESGRTSTLARPSKSARRLDELPIDLAGEPMGWGIWGADLEDFRDYEPAVEEEENEKGDEEDVEMG
ncbi:hypothetical protein CC86DRAFT_376915 [Ophiobolus disseminans]|uniref:Uncharacterized protein n=1 Tax=Ophiobolus disseminans TaxID=1469910 RepID=A0A6A7AMV0_9PLEO|nr:hypothetical protein CC86DRAFT_376915 [Ophiobolus disseminans]